MLGDPLVGGLHALDDPGLLAPVVDEREPPAPTADEVVHQARHAGTVVDLDPALWLVLAGAAEHREGHSQLGTDGRPVVTGKHAVEDEAVDLAAAGPRAERVVI